MDPSHGFGRRWGGYLGSKLGELAGGAAHGLFTKITGLGDYKVQKNIFLEGRLPQIVNVSSGGGTTIRFQEYLGDIYTSSTPGAFQIASYLINAANPRTFPYMSQIAANYEQYEFEGLIFEFKSTSADALNSTNTALGSVMMATQYDVLDAVFNSKTEMLNYEFSTSCKPSISNIHMIECAPSQSPQKLWYTLYNQQVPSNADPRLYHLGNFCIATTGFQGANVNIGELHVTYQVRLLKPKVFMSIGLDNSSWFFNTATAVSQYSNALPLGLPTIQSSEINTSGITISNSTSTISFPASNAILYWRMEFLWTATAAVCTYPIVTAAGGCTVVSTFGVNPGATNATACLLLGIRIDGTGGPTRPTITFGAAGSLPVAGTQQLIIRANQVHPSTLGN